MSIRIHIVPAGGKAINIVDALLRAFDGRSPEHERFAPLQAWAKSNVDLVATPAEASIVLYPSENVWEPAAAAAAASAHAAGRSCLFFNAGDTWDRFPLTTGTLYRTSLHRSLATPNERGMPAFVRNVQDEAREMNTDAFSADGLGHAPHRPEPSVGFCGYVGTTMNRLVALAACQFEKWKGLNLRHRVLRALERAPGIRTDFVTRAHFGGRATVEASRRQERIEFLRSVLENPYTLCLRGKGNFSFRLYEVLSAGRIPMFVDTSCVLPFEDELDWKTLLAWCDVSELNTIGDRLSAFHRRFDDKSFAAHQSLLQKTWAEYLSPLGFIQQIIKRHA